MLAQNLKKGLCCIYFGHYKSKRVLKLHDWLKNWGDYFGLVGFCVVVKFHHQGLLPTGLPRLVFFSSLLHQMKTRTAAVTCWLAHPWLPRRPPCPMRGWGIPLTGRSPSASQPSVRSWTGRPVSGAGSGSGPKPSLPQLSRAFHRLRTRNKPISISTL